MRWEPDGVEVVASAEDAAALAIPPLLVVDAVRQFLRSRGLGDGPVGWRRIGDGQSNVTYLIDTGPEDAGGRRMVLRRGPRPPLPRSTHDMLREARVQRLLGRAGVPVPRILAVCEDTGVLGVPFYLMEHIEGEVITCAVPRALDSPAGRAAVSAGAVDALVQLHSVDVSSGDLAALGRADGYLARQVERFAGLWAVNSRRSMPAVDALADWLAQNRPAAQRAALVHGDFRLGNLMFAPGGPARVSAILDWEMATLGDPLADLGYLTATYSQPGLPATVMELTPVTAQPHFASREGLVRRYREQIPVDVTALPWYQALALWKSAIFCEAMYSRWRAGERPGDAFAPALERGVPELLAAAGRFAGLRPRAASAVSTIT